MSDPTGGAVAPILTIAGGAGAMGSLFAELLLPRVRACLVVDLFASETTTGSVRAVPFSPIVERLSALVAGRDEEAQLWGWRRDASGSTVLLTGKEVRAAPAWLLFHRGGAPADLPALGAAPGDVTETLARLMALGDVTHIVGLLDPSEATTATRLCDVLLVATSFTSSAQFRSVLAPYAAGMRPGSLAVDVLSLKERPLLELSSLLPTSVGILGTHPLFGRTAGDVTGLVVSVVESPDARPAVAWHRWFLEQLAGLGMLVTPATAAEHDAAMSFVQALTHFTLLSFAFTFVRANQDPTQLLPYRTPVFEPTLYLAARVASLAHRTPEVYRAIQEECSRPELRRLFVATAQDLLRAIESGGRGPGDVVDGLKHSEECSTLPEGGEAGISSPAPRPPTPDPQPLADMLAELGAPWSPAYHRGSEPYEHLVSMSALLTEPINSLRHELLQSAGRIRAIQHIRTGSVTLGAIYVDPLHHDRVDLASRVRFHRFNPTSGVLDGADEAELQGLNTQQRRTRVEAGLGSLPLSQVRLLSASELINWLGAKMGPRVGPDRPALWQPETDATVDGYASIVSTGRQGPPFPEGSLHTPRLRYVGKAEFDLSLLTPDWLDADCVRRLLAGRGMGTADGGIVWSAALEPQQQIEQLAIPAGMRAVLIKIAVILYPDEVLRLRARARASAQADPAPGQRKRGRQLEDRRFVAAVAERQLAIRELVYTWLLRHGCHPVGSPWSAPDVE